MSSLILVQFEKNICGSKYDKQTSRDSQPPCLKKKKRKKERKTRGKKQSYWVSFTLDFTMCRGKRAVVGAPLCVCHSVRYDDTFSGMRNRSVQELWLAPLTRGRNNFPLLLVSVRARQKLYLLHFKQHAERKLHSTVYNGNSTRKRQQVRGGRYDLKCILRWWTICITI